MKKFLTEHVDEIGAGLAATLVCRFALDLSWKNSLIAGAGAAVGGAVLGGFIGPFLEE